MRIMVTGSRSYGPPSMWGSVRPRFLSTLTTVHAFFPVTELITGGAVGPDTWGAIWASMYGIDVGTHRPDPQEGETYGQACYRRDMEMLDLGPSFLVACWDGVSKGTKHTMDGAEDRHITIIEINTEGS